ncbi:MAG: glycosyltransferase [Deltaproteobacteria bacterium]|nr:glycosyltransferase [Deltaproteobacteria bacterium]
MTAAEVKAEATGSALRTGKVALVRNNFLPWSETFIHDEIRHHERYEVTVFARQWRNADRFPGNRVVAVERVPQERRRLASAWYAAFGRSRRLESALDAGGFSIVHAHFGHNGLYGLTLARRAGLPLVVSLHGRDVTILLGRDKYRPTWWHYLAGYKRLFREARLFLAASSELKELIVSAGCPAEKVVVHRLGIDLQALRPGTPCDGNAEPLVVMVGRFVEKKGHAYGIEAMAAARKAGCAGRLVIVGDGPLRREYERLVARLGLEGTVAMPGALSHAEVARLLAGASVVLAPSVVARNLDRESGLIVAKEAAACGVPVVGTRHGGIPEIVEDGVTGFLVEERDCRAMGEKLAALLGDPGLRRSLGRAARARMEREYDIVERVRALEGLYDAVIEGRAP